MATATKGRWLSGRNPVMKIELVEFDAEEAMHPHHAEIVVLATSDTALGPASWPDVWEALDRDQREFLGDQCGAHNRSSLGTSSPGGCCKFDVMDPEVEGFLQYWAFPKK